MEDEEKKKKKCRKDTYGADRREKKAEREKHETSTALSLDGQMAVFGGAVHSDGTGNDL